MPRFLTSEQLEDVIKACPARDPQIALLNALFAAHPRALLVHGPTSTGKTHVVHNILDQAATSSPAVDYVWIDCDQCNTIRIMLQRALRGIKKILSSYQAEEGSQQDPESAESLTISALSQNDDEDGRYILPTTIVHGNTTFDVVTENVSAFFLMLQLLLSKTRYPQRERKIFLVLDRIDQMNDNPSDLLSCFSRVRELAPEAQCLSTVFVISTLEPRSLLISHIPHVKFVNYTKEETIRILNHWGTEQRKLYKQLLQDLKQAQLQLQLLQDTKPIKTDVEYGGITDFVHTNGHAPASAEAAQTAADLQAQIDSLLKNHHICLLPDDVLSKDRIDYQQAQFWDRYCNVLIHALNSYAGSDIRLLKELARKIWPAFIYPVLVGKCTIYEAKTLWNENKHLFVTEAAVSNSLIDKPLEPLQDGSANSAPSILPANEAQGGLLEPEEIEDEDEEMEIDPTLGGERKTSRGVRSQSESPRKGLSAAMINAAVLHAEARTLAAAAAEAVGAAPGSRQISSVGAANSLLLAARAPSNSARSNTPLSRPLSAAPLSQQSQARTPGPTARHPQPSIRRTILPLKPQHRDTNELPVQSKYILCAAYLASYNPPRFDIRFFSRAKEARAKRRDTGRRKVLQINPRMLAAPAFDLERMLAILHAIAPSGGGGSTTEGSKDRVHIDPPYSDENGGFPSNIDLGVQIATLTTLRLIICLNPADPLDSKTRWKINANWTIIKRVADEISLPIEEFLIE